jgi:hypothetical protein
MASRAIPSHLKPSSAAGKDEGGFNSQRHHGKSQSHVVSCLPFTTTLQSQRPPPHQTLNLEDLVSTIICELFTDLNLNSLGWPIWPMISSVSRLSPTFKASTCSGTLDAGTSGSVANRRLHCGVLFAWPCMTSCLQLSVLWLKAAHRRRPKRHDHPSTIRHQSSGAICTNMNGLLTRHAM